MKTLILILLLIFSYNLFSQDVIIKQNGEKVNCKITKTDSKNIYYNIYMTGRMREFSIPRKEIKSIEYNKIVPINILNIQPGTLTDSNMIKLVDKEVVVQLKNEKIQLGKFIKIDNDEITLLKVSNDKAIIDKKEILGIESKEDRKNNLEKIYKRSSFVYDSLSCLENWLGYPAVVLIIGSDIIYSRSNPNSDKFFVKNGVAVSIVCNTIGSVLFIGSIVAWIRGNDALKQRDGAKHGLEELTYILKPYINPYNNSYGLAFNIRF